jgi:Domain of unknown function (DUF222)/HNH endonuclease
MFEWVDEAVRASNAALADVLREVARVDADGSWAREGATSTSAWVCGRYRLTRGTAIEWVRVAKALTSLPAISGAARSGQLSWDQLRPLTRFASAETDAELARSAPSMSAPELWDEARRHERIRDRDVEDTHRSRYLSLDWNEQRTELYLQGRLGAEQGAALERAVSKRSEEIVVADDPWDPQGARLADALVELASESVGEAVPPILVIHADASVLTEEAPASGRVLCQTEDGTAMSSEAVRRLACDSRIEWMLERDHRPVGIGRRGRTVRGSMLRALRFRDRGCVFPGCGRIRWLKAHHVVHWAHGGGTDLENLVLVCDAHHRLVHEGGWSIRGRPGRDLRFLDPRGREPFLRQARLVAA